MEHFFVVILRYLVEWSVLEQHRPAHLAFLDAQYQQGFLIASGPQTPRLGGVILARGIERPALEALFQQDPFALHHLAEYTILECTPTRAIPEFNAITSKPAQA